MWMFSMLTSALGRKWEPAHEVGKHSKAHSAVPASLVSGMSCGLHLMNFNLNVTIFIEWQLDITECKTEKPPQWEFEQGSHRFSLSLFGEVTENLWFCRMRMQIIWGGVYKRLTWVLSTWKHLWVVLNSWSFCISAGGNLKSGRMRKHSFGSDSTCLLGNQNQEVTQRRRFSSFPFLLFFSG